MSLIPRLTIIEQAIALGDEELAAAQAAKLPVEAGELAELIRDGEYGAAAGWILRYRGEKMGLAEYADPEAAGLRMELTKLEAELSELVAERGECVRKIAEFHAAYMAAVGDVLAEVLRLRAEKDAKAREEYAAFEKQRAETPEPVRLDAEERVELRKLFKRAAHLCHPDKQPAHKQAEAARVFAELEAANRTGDLARVREIHARLQGGDWSVETRAEDADALRRRIAAVRAGIAKVREEIAALKGEETWRLMAEFEAEGKEWEGYFAEVREGLEGELGKV